jgi:hypothetical protein
MNALEPLLLVARRLGPLAERVVFVGGAVRGLLITDPAAATERPTDDVDLIVELASAVAYHRFGRELRASGFREDTSAGAPLCRWIVEAVRVDVMPTEGSVLGFRNRWYPDAMAHAVRRTVRGQTLRILDAPHFCATKLDAFADRGHGDFYHHDLEDLIAVVDGREELLAEVQAATPAVRHYVAEQIAMLLKTPAFIEALPGHLPGDPGSQARLPLVRARLEGLGALAEPA